MCWSGEASTVLAAIGLSSTVYFYRKKEPAVICITLGIFHSWKPCKPILIPSSTSAIIRPIRLPYLLGYLHIAFQPFFINAISLYFIPAEIRARIATPVYSLCFVATLCLLIRIYPFEWIPACYEVKYKFLFLNQFFDSFTVPFCGERICSVSGQWHSPGKSRLLPA